MKVWRMGWTSNDYKHEGGFAAVALDGGSQGLRPGREYLSTGSPGTTNRSRSSSLMRRSFPTTSS